jgi:MtN3 and saliva related transmembrane protein
MMKVKESVFIDMIGYIGGTVLGLQLIPQIYKAYKTKSTGDISIFFLAMNIVGLGFMTTYGLCNDDMPLYIPTSVSLINSIFLFFMVKLNSTMNTDSSVGKISNAL